MSSRRLSDSSGFTLIEVMISLVIITFIALGIYQATVETYHVRDVVAAEGEFYNGIRMAMDIVSRDISTIYSPTLAKLPEPSPTLGQNPNQPPSPEQQRELQDLASSDAGRTTQYWLPATEKTGIRPSRFVGTDNKMTFVAASHVRIYKDAPESAFSKVSYELVKNEDPTIPEYKDTFILMKTESPNVFDDDDRRDRQYQHRYPLLYGVKKLRYRYWRQDKEQWLTSWDNEKEDLKENFPDMIEVTFEVVGPQKLSFEGNYRFRPEVPLRGLNPSF